VNTIGGAYFVYVVGTDYSCYINWTKHDHQNVAKPIYKIDCYLPDVLDDTYYSEDIHRYIYSEKSPNVTAVYGRVETVSGSLCPIMHLHDCKYSEVDSKIFETSYKIFLTLYILAFIFIATATLLRIYEILTGIATKNV